MATRQRHKGEGPYGEDCKGFQISGAIHIRFSIQHCPFIIPSQDLFVLLRVISWIVPWAENRKRSTKSHERLRNAMTNEKCSCCLLPTAFCLLPSAHRSLLNVLMQQLELIAFI